MSTDTAGRLKSFVERIERVEDEIRDSRSSVKEIYDELKGEGFDGKVIRKIVARRRRDRDEIEAEESLMETYLSALEEAGASK